MKNAGFDEINEAMWKAYEPALRAELERPLLWLPPARPLTRWQRITRPFRRFGHRMGEVWNVARHGADYYREY